MCAIYEFSLGFDRFLKVVMDHNNEQGQPNSICLLIHSADPQSRPVVIIIFAHVIRLFVRSSGRRVRPHFSNLAKQNNRK